MPKVSITSNDVDGTVESVPIDMANITDTFTATVIESVSKVDTIAIVIPKIPPFPKLTEDSYAGVDVDAVKLNGEEQDNNNDDEDNFYDPITENESISFPFNHDSPTIKEQSTKKAKTVKNNDTQSKPKGRNYAKEKDTALCEVFINLSANAIEGTETRQEVFCKDIHELYGELMVKDEIPGKGNGKGNMDIHYQSSLKN